MTIMIIKRYCKGLSKSNFRLRIKGIDFKNSHYVTNSIPGPLHIWMATEENQGYIQCENNGGFLPDGISLLLEGIFNKDVMLVSIP